MFEQKTPVKRSEIAKNNAPLIWATFTYGCEKCGKEITAQLAVGVEGPDRSNYIPSPFTVGCDSCTGFMVHVDWFKDERFSPRLAEEGYAFIAGGQCGNLVRVSDGGNSNES